MSFAAVEAALAGGRLAHALLFLGPEGAGQREAARELASKLLGVPPEKAEGHPDFRAYSPPEDSRTFSLEEQIRPLIAEANLKPFQAPAKVFVLEPAEALRDDAQNALLKTLEEPPPSTYFILIANAAEKLLPTVRSRMQTVHFSASSKAEEMDEDLERAKNALWRRVEQGPGAGTPDLSGLTREETLAALEHGIRQLRETLLSRVGSGEEDGLIRRIETLADYKEKISMNVNTKLALSVLWEEI